jgi:hypothetical protein
MIPAPNGLVWWTRLPLAVTRQITGNSATPGRLEMRASYVELSSLERASVVPKVETPAPRYLTKGRNFLMQWACWRQSKPASIQKVVLSLTCALKL